MKKIVLIVMTLAAVGYSFFESAPVDERIKIADKSSMRTLSAGAVIGFKDKHNTHAWLGIPFAQPPLGDLRWRAPQPPAAWAEPLEALSAGNICTQVWGVAAGINDAEAGDIVGSEDCLYLNVWAPALANGDTPPADNGLPVMLWIHGGGNSVGAGSTYVGHHLAGSQNVIVVAINYRLGIQGWFSHPALRKFAANPEDASGNYGLLDIIASLDWVQNNIAAFGGNPNNITVFGESAGGHNVASLLASPLAKGKFHRAIVQSGSMKTTPQNVAESAVDSESSGHENSSAEILANVLVADGTVSERSATKEHLASMSDAAVRQYLYTRTPEQLYAPFRDVPHGMYSVVANIRDGYVLPDQASMERFSDPALYNSVPVMLGTTRDEFKLFMAQDPRWVKTWFGFLPRLRDVDSFNRYAAYYSDNWKALAVDEPAEILQATQGNTVFTYRFDWDELPSNWLVDLPLLLGASHGFEIAFVLGGFDSVFLLSPLLDDSSLPGRLQLSEAMMEYWAEFAYNGNPGRGTSGTQPQWHAWGSSAGNTLLLDTEADGGIRMTDGTVTAASLKQRLLRDPHVVDAEQRCELYRDLFLSDWQVAGFGSEGEYQAFGEGCSQ